MSQDPKKMAVLAALQLQGKPVSLPLLLEQLGKEFSERSVRRWLTEMSTQGLVKKEGAKRATQYEITAEGKALQTSTGLFSKQSNDAITYVSQSLLHRDPKTYNSTWLDSYLPNETHYLTKNISQQLFQVGEKIKQHELNDINPLIDLYKHSYLHTCKLYDATVEMVGFDEVKVRYRQQRRQIIGHIITHQLIGAKMQKYILTEIEKHIPEKDRTRLKEIIAEDLQFIAPPRIFGMGVTIEQLNAWLRLRN